MVVIFELPMNKIIISEIPLVKVEPPVVVFFSALSHHQKICVQYHNSEETFDQ